MDAVMGLGDHTGGILDLCDHDNVTEGKRWTVHITVS